jgi:hypothetical protein
LIYRDKGDKCKIAGVIGSIDLNKQTHVSICRALNGGCEHVKVFGEPKGSYYDSYVKPLCGSRVTIEGFSDNKQSMYDSIDCVYHSSLSEVACLVKDECNSTGTKFIGTDATNTDIEDLTNSQIINRWIEILR